MRRGGRGGLSGDRASMTELPWRISSGLAILVRGTGYYLKLSISLSLSQPAATNPNKTLSFYFLLSIYRRPLTCIETLTCFACCLGQHCSQVRSIQCSQATSHSKNEWHPVRLKFQVAATPKNDNMPSTTYNSVTTRELTIPLSF